MRFLLSFVFALGWSLALALAPAIGHAQTPPTDAALARSELSAGVAAAEEGRWADALASFRRAYALSPQPTTLLNVASAEAQTGQLVHAAESYRLVLRAGEGEITAEQRAAVRARLESLEARIPRLRIVVRSRMKDDRVELDGAAMTAGALAAEIPVDPGAHVARLVRGGSAVDEARKELAEGQRATVTLESPEPLAATSPVAPAPRRAAAAETPSRSFVTSPWFWGGVAVVLVGTGAILCATTLCEGSPSPHAGTLGTVSLR